MKEFEYYSPDSLDEAFRLSASMPGSRYISGGTDVMVRIRNRDITPEALVSLRNISDLRGIDVGSVTSIGGSTTIAELTEHPELKKMFPLLVQAARKLGSAQIRNAATIAGNLCNCSPCADTAPALIVLDARAQVKSPDSEREVSMEELFVGPGQSCLNRDEILASIILDPTDPGARAVYMKKGRVKMDLAIASVAVLLVMKGDRCTKARVAAGSVAPVPLRLKEVEKVLKGAVITEDVIEKAKAEAMKSVEPIDDVRASADYRRHIVGVFVQRAVRQLIS